jgi:hypothetical protein
VDHAHQVDIRLAHHVSVSEAVNYLVRELGCDAWYVACHHDHLFVLRLTGASADRFALRFECTAPVEKGIYHDSRAWSLSISPLHDETSLSESQAKHLQAGLAELK